MKHIFASKSTTMSLIGMSMLFILGFRYPQAIEHVALPIAIISGGLSFARSWEGIKTTAKGGSNEKPT